MTWITTFAGLNALPVGAAAIDTDGDTWTRHADGWVHRAPSGPVSAIRYLTDEVFIYAPFRMPDEEPSPELPEPSSPGRHGPYDDMGQLADAVHHVYLSSTGVPRGPVEMAWINRGDLLSSLLSAGVRLGAYDMHLIEQFGTLKPEAVAAVCGWIKRAHLDVLERTLDEARDTDTQLLEARLAMTRCVHGECVESGIRPVGQPFACELHKTTTEA